MRVRLANPLALALAVSALTLWGVFSRLSAGGPWGFPLFCLAVGVLGYAPGRLVLDALGLKPSPLERLVLSVVLGLTATAFAFQLCRAVALPRLFWVFVVGALALLAARRLARGDAGAGWDRAERNAALALIGLFGLSAVLLYLSPFYYRNLVRTADGGLTFYWVPDAFLHLSVTRELVHTSPPLVPFMPDLPLRYHYGMDLVQALFAQLPGLAVEDLAARFVPSLFFALALGGGFLAGRSLGLSAGAAAACAFLSLFGEDLSFVPALLRGAPPGLPWTATLLQAPTIVSLLTMNPMLPALALLFTALFALSRFAEDGGWRWLTAFALLVAPLFDVKVFAGVQLLLALGLAAVLGVWRRRDARWAWPTLAVLLVLLLRLGPMLQGSAAGTPLAPEIGGQRLSLQAWPYVPAAMINLGLWKAPPGVGLDALFQPDSPLRLPAVALAGATLLYLVLVFGVRCVGAGACFRSLRGAGGVGCRRVAALFVLVGPLLTLCLTILPADDVPGRGYNNAIWFLVQSKYVAWLFAAESLSRLWASRGRGGRSVIVLATLGLSLPSAVQFVALQASEAPRRLDPRLVEVADFVRARVVPGDVLLAPEGVGAPLIALTPGRAMVPGLVRAFEHTRPMRGGTLSREEAVARIAAFQAFWRAWLDPASGDPALDGLGRVDWVVAPPVARPLGTFLVEVFRNPALVVYDVVGPPASPPRQAEAGELLRSSAARAAETAESPRPQARWGGR